MKVCVLVSQNMAVVFGARFATVGDNFGTWMLASMFNAVAWKLRDVRGCFQPVEIIVVVGKKTFILP